MAYSVATIVGQPSNSKTPITVTLRVADYASEAAVTAIINSYAASFGAYCRYEDGQEAGSSGTILPEVQAAPKENSTYTCGWITLKYKGQDAQVLEIPSTMYDIQGFIDTLWATGMFEFMNYYYRAYNATVGVGSHGTNYNKTNQPKTVIQNS